jgi:hypothetical protein
MPLGIGTSGKGVSCKSTSLGIEKLHALNISDVIKIITNIIILFLFKIMSFNYYIHYYKKLCEIIN